MNDLTKILTIALALMLAGCGGGGGGSAATPPPVVTPAPAVTTDPLGVVGSTQVEQLRLFREIAEEVLSPLHQAFMATSGTLAMSIEGYCAGPSNANLETARSDWRLTMLAWQRIQFIQAGPVEEANRRSRIQFYPDLNSAVENNTNALLASSGSLAEALVANSAVGAQGLPALEYLLFELDLGDAIEGPRRCEAANAIVDNLATMAGELAAGWTSGSSFYSDFINGNGVFTDGDDVLVVILEALAIQGEKIADRKISDAIVAGSVDALESFRSETSLENIRVNLEVFSQMFDTGEDNVYRLRDYLERAHDADEVGVQVRAEIDRANSGVGALNATLEGIVAGQATGDIETIRQACQQIATLMVDAAVAANVNLGFNNQDGD
jgi:hypothetical protein